MKKEKGWLVDYGFAVVLPAVTLWKVGPFRRVIFRDFSGKCYKYFGCCGWEKAKTFKMPRK